jgi:hypothetical protein
LRVRIGRLAAVFAILLVTATLVGAVDVAPMNATGPDGLDRFMDAVGQVESHGDYGARNPTSGAYGKYQFMPASWRGWAKRYLGDANAEPTPRNQDIVAAARMTDLYKGLGSWRRVAYWWLTGSSRTAGWTKYATSYVNRVMRIYDKAPIDPARPAKPTPTATPKPKATPKASATPRPVAATIRHLSDSDAAIRYTGAWRSARFPAYERDTVRYATAPGARATLAFAGHAVTWYGPVGPTRGRARVFVDGKLATTVDLAAKAFAPRKPLFATTWPANGKHTIAIEVVGTKGRPFVAIDELTVTEERSP